MKTLSLHSKKFKQQELFYFQNEQGKLSALYPEMWTRQEILKQQQKLKFKKGPKPNKLYEYSIRRENKK